MREAAILLLLLAGACRGPGYRKPGESEAVRKRIDDRNVATRVRLALGEDPVTASYDGIRVACVEGVVTLEGTVDREEVRARAGELAAGCEGVRSVINRIRIASASG